jgi:hypothetical protein
MIKKLGAQVSYLCYYYVTIPSKWNLSYRINDDNTYDCGKCTLLENEK